MEIFVISLKHSVERRKYISEQLSKLRLDFTFFDAYMGIDYMADACFYSEVKAKKQMHRTLLPGEIGCALSHNALYNLIVQKSIPYALILEDDVVLSKDVVPVLQALVPYCHGSRIITLDRCDVYKKKSKVHLVDDYYVVKPRYIREGGMANASGYIITQEAAKAICSVNIPVWSPADSWGIYKKYVDFFGVIPTQTVIYQNKSKFISTIQADGITNELSLTGDEAVGHFTARQLFLYGLKTYVPVVSHFYRFVRWIYRNALKRLLKRLH